MNGPLFSQFVGSSSCSLETSAGRDAWGKELLGYADADGPVGAFFLAIGDIGAGADAQTAFDGGVLIGHEVHGLGTSGILLQFAVVAGGL